MSSEQARLASLDPADDIEDDKSLDTAISSYEDTLDEPGTSEGSIVWIVIPDDSEAAVLIGVATASIEDNDAGGNISDHIEVKLLRAHAPS